MSHASLKKRIEYLERFHGSLEERKQQVVADYQQYLEELHMIWCPEEPMPEKLETWEDYKASKRATADLVRELWGDDEYREYLASFPYLSTGN